MAASADSLAVCEQRHWCIVKVGSICLTVPREVSEKTVWSGKAGPEPRNMCHLSLLLGLPGKPGTTPHSPPQITTLSARVSSLLAAPKKSKPKLRYQKRVLFSFNSKPLYNKYSERVFKPNS